MANENERRAFYHILFPRKDENKGMTDRVPDANETRLNLNFKIISDELKKLWDFIKNGFKTKSLTVDGDASIGGDAAVDGQLSAGTAALGDTNVNGALDVDGSATFDDGVTIGGVLDVTPRRCYAILSQPGWYRVLSFSGTSAIVQGSAGTAIKLHITRQGSTQSAETHSITYRATNGGGGAFVDEESLSGVLWIDKIRATYTGTNLYIDIHYAGTTGNSVSVTFNVYDRAARQSYYKAESLQSVADAPSGETIPVNLTHDFSANLSPTYLKRYVDSTAANYTIGSGGYVIVSYPSGLTGNKVVSIGIETWTSNSGPFSICPYGSTNTYWYIIGSSGTTINGIKFVYWYID